MPGVNTYLYFSQRLLPLLPASVRELLEELYPDAYLLGALGAEVLSPQSRLKAVLNNRDILAFFEELARHIYQSGSKAQQAYAIGYVVNYVVNSRLNPYIYYLYEHGVPYLFRQGREFLNLETISTGIDANYYSCLTRTEKQKSEKFKPDPFVVDEIMSLYEHAVSPCVGFKTGTLRVRRAMNDVSIRKPEGYNTEALDYTNRNKTVWNTVRNGRWETDMSLDELFEKLLVIGEKLVVGYCNRLFYGNPLDENAYRLNHLGII